MKRISLWGRRHKWAARAIIVLCYIILSTLAAILGDGLLSYGIEVNALWIYLFTAAYLTAFFLYPFRRERKRYRNFYRWQKTCDGVLVTTSFLLITCAVNLRHSSNTPFHYPAVHATVPVSIHPPKPASIKKTAKSRSLVKTFKMKLSYALQKTRAFYKGRSLAGQIFLVLLAVVFAAVLLYLVMAISCSIACAGSGAAAIVVAVIGTAAVGFLFVRALRGIRRIPRKNTDKEAPRPPIV